MNFKPKYTKVEREFAKALDAATALAKAMNLQPPAASETVESVAPAIAHITGQPLADVKAALETAPSPAESLTHSLAIDLCAQGRISWQQYQEINASLEKLAAERDRDRASEGLAMIVAKLTYLAEKTTRGKGTGNTEHVMWDLVREIAERLPGEKQEHIVAKALEEYPDWFRRRYPGKKVRKPLAVSTLENNYSRHVPRSSE